MLEHRIITAIFLLLVTGFWSAVESQGREEIQRLEAILEDRPEEVIPRLEEIVQSNPSPEVYFLLARAWSLVDANQSLGWLEKLFAISPEHEDGWQLWADIMDAGGQHEYAVLRLEQQLRRYPESSYLRLLLAQIHVNQGAFSKAENEFRQAVEMGTEGVHATRALYSLGYLYVRLGKVEEGEALLRRVLEHDSAHVPTLTGLAELFINTGRWKEAKSLLSRAAGLEPENPEVLLLLGHYHLKQKEWPEAVDTLRKLLEKQPDHVQGHFFLGQAYKGEKKLEQAMEHFRTFQELKQEALARSRNEQQGLAVQGAQ